MVNNKHFQDGITLVETLVALAILGAVTSSIVVLIAQNTRFEADARCLLYTSPSPRDS